jgi:hypothetical protein
MNIFSALNMVGITIGAYFYIQGYEPIGVFLITIVVTNICWMLALTAD